MRIFADTSALVALFNTEDPDHERAKILSKKIGTELQMFSNYIFAECVTILSQKVGKEKSLYAGDFMKKNLQEIRIEKEVENLAWELFKKQTSKNVSFVDCTTFALYKMKVFDKAFSFDQDFRANKIPLLD